MVAFKRGHSYCCVYTYCSYFQYVYHLLTLRKGLDGFREIGIGATVFTNEPSIERQHDVGIDAEELLHRELWRGCQLDNAQMTALSKHAAHL